MSDYIAFAMVLVVLIVLFFGLLYAGFLWYNQIDYALAVQEGAYTAGLKGSNMGYGYEAIRGVLMAAWGQAPSAVLVPMPGERVVRGYVERQVALPLPLGGTLTLHLRASGLHRKEQFYGGRPAKFE